MQVIRNPAFTGDSGMWTDNAAGANMQASKKAANTTRIHFGL